MHSLLWLLLIWSLVVPSVSHSETWEEFQKMKAAGEESGLIPKGGGKLKSKDIIIEGLKKDCQVTYQSDELLFHYGSPRLKDESRQNLQNTADALKEAANNAELSKIQAYYVDGHTCSIGTVENNCRLSWLRAQAVGDELVKLGIPREKIIPRGFGLGYPAHSNEAEATRMLNRRVVLKGDCPETKAKDNAVPCRAEAAASSSGSSVAGTDGSATSRTSSIDSGNASEESPMPGLGRGGAPLLIPLGKSAPAPSTVKGFKKVGEQGASQDRTGVPTQENRSQKATEEKTKPLPRGFKPATQ